MTGHQIRRAFLDYFVRHGHTEVPSSPVIPAEDPTLLFTNAGMNPFKSLFTGQERRPYQRATSTQKCIRVSGKHNDLENVGRTPRHHTFFEMLGNFSFGDYFKQEAVAFAWEWLTAEMGLQKERLYVTIFEQDDEAEQVWKSATDIDPRRIYRLGRDSNYWSMGDTGPQGPCSEILYDLAPTPATDPGAIDPEQGDRFLEIWNLVFMQYDAQPGGEVLPLPAPSIDTGMGLERVASILQGVASNYDTDLLRPLIDQTEAFSGCPYDPGPGGVSHRVIADHLRALGFAIADGVIPANDGRGYVLRRLLRRAARHARSLNRREPFLCRLVPTLVEQMGGAFPELHGAAARIERVIRTEEERFGETLDQGIARFEEVVGEIEQAGDRAIPGRQAFVLYDRYGFPFDLTEVMARERGLEVEGEGFEQALAEQQERSRADRAARGAGAEESARRAAELLPEDLGRLFVGYEPDRWTVRSRLVALFDELFEPLEALGQGERGWIVLEETPFYAEAGGQVADTGVIEGEDFEIAVERVDRHGGVLFHRGTVASGIARTGEVEARIDAPRRRRIMRNHTATHLMHAALREVLGTHVQQAGSVVDPERLRFDFAHFAPLDEAEETEVVGWVNRGIRANVPLQVHQMPYAEALEKGALAFFGEKYGDLVRVVDIPGWSMELCGGTHVTRTGDIGYFRLEQEGSIASGVRRVEGVTARRAVAHDLETQRTVHRLAELTGASERDLSARIEALLEEHRVLRRRLEKALLRQGLNQVDSLLEKAQDIGGIAVVAGAVESGDPEQLRRLADAVRENLRSGIGVLGARQAEKAVLLCVVTDDLVRTGWKAGTVVSRVAALTGGRGGGRPHLAQAGGIDADRLGEALAAVPEIVRSLAEKPS
jgi:alanyl-tRNA synthetase